MRSHRKNSPVYFLFVSILLLFILTVFIVYSFQVSYIFGVNITFSKFQRQCEPLHIAMIIGGEKTVLQAVTLFKSVLARTQHPIHFHLIADKVAAPILQTLFDSWNIPAVTANLYDLESYINRVSWIPNIHYSGNFGLSKLLLPEILPPNVERVILLDTDTLVLTDIFELWDRFYFMRPGEAIAMTENFSGWYTQGFVGKKWPAIGQGFNSGVVLLNLYELRKINFDKLWRTVAKKYLATIGTSLLADQDILNAVAYEKPKLIYKLSSEFNVQLGPNSSERKIQHLDPKILHWNSKNKSSTTHPELTLLRRHFENLDAISLTLTRYECSSQQIMSREQQAEPCDEFIPERKYKTHIFLRPFQLDKPGNNITIVTQLSADRLTMLIYLIQSWEGPISVAIYATDSEMNEILLFIQKQFPNRDNLAVHGVHKDGNVYPINYLRNVALNASRTSHVLLLDGDFILGQEFSITETLEYLHTNSLLILPAFEFTTSSYINESIGLTKAKVVEKLETKEIVPFRQNIWPYGHKATHFDKWKNATKPFQVEWESNFEPYVLGRKDDIPTFSGKFGGFGWNKVTHSLQMAAKGLRFLVHPNAFIIHQPHPPSNELVKFRSNPLYRKCMASLKRKFVTELSSRTPAKQ